MPRELASRPFPSLLTRHAVQVCRRHMHEECDAKNMLKGVCIDCHDVRRDMYAIEHPPERMEVDLEGHGEDVVASVTVVTHRRARSGRFGRRRGRR